MESNQEIQKGLVLRLNLGFVRIQNPGNIVPDVEGLKCKYLNLLFVNLDASIQNSAHEMMHGCIAPEFLWQGQMIQGYLCCFDIPVSGMNAENNSGPKEP